MSAIHLTQRKEVAALDADVPLLRPSLIRSYLSDPRLFQADADHRLARHFFALYARWVR